VTSFVSYGTLKKLRKESTRVSPYDIVPLAPLREVAH